MYDITHKHDISMRRSPRTVLTDSSARVNHSVPGSLSRWLYVLRRTTRRQAEWLMMQAVVAVTSDRNIGARWQPKHGASSCSFLPIGDAIGTHGLDETSKGLRQQLRQLWRTLSNPSARSYCTHCYCLSWRSKGNNFACLDGNHARMMCLALRSH